MLRAPSAASLIECASREREALRRVNRELLLAPSQLGAKTWITHSVGEHDLCERDTECRDAKAVDECNRGISPDRQLASVVRHTSVLSRVASLVHLADARPSFDLPGFQCSSDSAVELGHPCALLQLHSVLATGKP